MIEPVGAQSAIQIPMQARILNPTEASIVWLLSWAGDPNHTIAAKMGTMPGRVADILAENTHVGSKDKASQMVGAGWLQARDASVDARSVVY